MIALIETIWGWMNDAHVLSVAIVLQAGLGMALQLLMVRERRRGQGALAAEGINGEAQFVSKTDIRLDSGLLAVFGLFLAIGLVATVGAFAGKPPFNPVERFVGQYGTYIIRQGLMAIMTILLASSLYSRYRWRRLIKMIGDRQ